MSDEKAAPSPLSLDGGGSGGRGGGLIRLEWVPPSLPPSLLTSLPCQDISLSEGKKEGKKELSAKEKERGKEGK